MTDAADGEALYDLDPHTANLVRVAAWEIERLTAEYAERVAATISGAGLWRPETPPPWAGASATGPARPRTHGERAETLSALLADTVADELDHALIAQAEAMP